MNANNSKKMKWILPVLIVLLVILVSIPFVVFTISKKKTGDIKWNISIAEAEANVKEKYPDALIAQTADTLVLTSGNDARGLFWEDLECVRIWYGFSEVYGLEKIVVSMEESDTADFDSILQKLTERYGEAEITDEGSFGKTAAWTTSNSRVTFESAGEGKTFKLDDEREAAYRLIYEEEIHSLRDRAPVKW